MEKRLQKLKNSEKRHFLRKNNRALEGPFSNVEWT